MKVLSLQFCRFHLNYWSYFTSLNIVQLRELRSGCKWGSVAMARKKAFVDSVVEEPNENGSVVKKKASGSSKRSSTRTRKKTAAESLEEDTDILVDRDATIEERTPISSEDSKETTRRTRRKGNASLSSLEEDTDILVDRDTSIAESTPTSSERSKKTARRTRRNGNVSL